jgi:hypothetical protein
MPINSKQKGSRGELEFVHYLRDEFGWGARRTQQFCGKAGDSDVIIEDLPGVHAEIKRVEKLNLQDAVDQAVRDSCGNLPIVFHRRNRGKWLMTMEFTSKNVWDLYKGLKETPDETR